jgi:Tfp pilus assembly protein PilP
VERRSEIVLLDLVGCHAVETSELKILMRETRSKDG